MNLSYRNIIFNVCVAIVFLYEALTNGAMDFIFQDTTFISFAILVLYPIGILRYIIKPINESSFLYRFSNLYFSTLSSLGVLGTMIGFYVALLGLQEVQLSADNVSLILQGVSAGVFIALISSICGIVGFLLILANRFLYGINDSEV